VEKLVKNNPRKEIHTKVKAPIIEAMKKAWEHPTYQFHIPGHTKGRAVFEDFKQLTGQKVLALDTTDEFDNLGTLHPATGPIKEALELAAQAFGAKRTFFLLNGSTVGKDDFIMIFDSVANSTASGGGTASAGVNSLNGFQGDLTLKTINGKNLIGSGDIEIEGGGSGTAGVNKVILGQEDYGWNTYKGDIKLTTGFTTFDEGDTGYDIAVAGIDAYGGESGSLWFGMRSINGSIIMEDAGGRVNFKVNEWIGTQSEYDALGEYDSNCTYYITE
jgi:hypothetical protein